MKLKGSALYYALVFAILIAIVSGSLILFSFYSRTELKVYLDKQRLIQNVNSGFELLKSKNYPYQSTSIDLFGKGNDTIYIVKKHWGLFDAYGVKAKGRNEQVEKSALIGLDKSKHQQTALYMSDLNKALSLSGETKLKGKVYISKAGVKRASIEGKNYIGKDLIYGEKLNSEKQLPSLNLKTQEYAKALLKGNFQNDFDLKDISDLSSFGQISNAFSEKTNVYFSNTRINLNNIVLKGNIVIYSKQEITVNKTCILENVVLVSPSVVLQRDVKSSVHIIAEDSIILEENVILEYPTSLALTSEKNGYIQIGINSVITGDLVLNGVNNLKKSNFVNIEKDALIEGNVFCNGIISLKGKVYGSVFCEKFYLKTSSAIYENYLLDAEIDNSQRNENYSSGFIFEEPGNKKIVNWN